MSNYMSLCIMIAIGIQKELTTKNLSPLNTLNKKSHNCGVDLLYLYEQISLTILINEIFKGILFRIVFKFIA